MPCRRMLPAGVCAAALSRLWHSASGLRIQDGPGNLESWDDADQHEELQQSLVEHAAGRAGNAGGLGRWVGTTTIPAFGSSSTKVKAKLHCSGKVRSSSFDDFSIEMNYDYMELLETPTGVLNFVFDNFEGPLNVVAASGMRAALHQAQGMLDKQKQSVKKMIRDVLLHSDNVFVNWWIPRPLKEGLAATGIELLSNARIGFQQRNFPRPVEEGELPSVPGGGTVDEDKFRVIVEIPWVRPEVGRQLCHGLAQFGPHTFFLIAPFVFAAAVVHWNNFNRTAIMIFLVGVVLLNGIAFRPACNSLSMSMLTVSSYRGDFNTTSISTEATEYAGRLGLPEMFGADTSWEEDAFRVLVDWVSHPKLKNLIETAVTGMIVDEIGLEVIDFNLDFGLREYQLEILPSTYVIAVLDASVALGTQTLKTLEPTAKQCLCLHTTILSWCARGEFICNYRVKMHFTGSVDMTIIMAESSASKLINLKMEYVDAVNVPAKMLPLLTQSDSIMTKDVTRLFTEKTQPLQENSHHFVRKRIKAVLLAIAQNHTNFEYDYFPLPVGFAEDFGRIIEDNINQTQFYFEPTGDDVLITAEIPDCEPRVASSLCEHTATVTWIYRIVPFAMVAAFLALRIPRTAAVFLFVSLVLTYGPNAKIGCEAFAPSILEIQQDNNFVAFEQTDLKPAELEQLADLGFPTNITFSTNFKNNKFQIMFAPVPRLPFNEAVNKVIRNTDDEDEESVREDWEISEGGKRFDNAEIELVMDGYNVEFSVSSWMATSGRVGLSRDGLPLFGKLRGTVR